jgi:poly(ADP-ribose) glycohydrolase ARH3
LDKSRVKSKYKGALIGTAVGDALGALIEGRGGLTRYEINSTIKNVPMLSYTDDSHMMIGVAESLIHSRGFNAGDMLKRFIKNYDFEPDRGYGSGPPYIFEQVKRGADWKVVSNDMYQGGSYGNGSAMRAAPIGVFYNNNISELNRVARESSEITHAHPLGKEGSALQAYAIALASMLEPASEFSRTDFIANLVNFCRDGIFRAKLDIINKFSGELDKDGVARELGNGIEVFNSVPASIYSFLTHPKSFEEAVMYAIGLGGNTDTIGAMTGAISGAYLGFQAIPHEWILKLENRAFFETLAEQLLAAKIESIRTGDYI